MPADAGIDDRGTRLFDRQRQLLDLLPTGAVFHQIKHRQPVDQNEFRAHGLAYRPDGLDGEPHAVGEAAAPLVVALVGARRQELVDQVAFGTHHFNAVVAGLLRQRRAAGEVGDGLRDLRFTQGARRKRVDWRLQRGRGHQLGLIAVAAGVQDLQRNFAARPVDGLGYRAVVRQLRFAVEDRTAAKHHALFVRGNAAGDDQRHAGGGALGIERGQALRAVGQLFQAGMHRSHQHPVFQGGEAEIQRRQQVRVIAHCTLHRSSPASFNLQRCCLRSLAPVTYLSKLLGTPELAA